jgi:hypothetical protein
MNIDVDLEMNELIEAIEETNKRINILIREKPLRIWRGYFLGKIQRSNNIWLIVIMASYNIIMKKIFLNHIGRRSPW